MTAWVFEARHRPTLLNEIKITKLRTNTEPQAGINILCAPSMGEGIERYRIIPEGVNPLQASWRSLLVSRKVVCCEASTEGSETTKSGTDEQERYTEAD